MLIKILRQWVKFGDLVKSCFAKSTQVNDAQDEGLKLEDLLNGPISAALPVTITPTASPSLLVAFPAGKTRETLEISVLENGELDFNVDEHLKPRLNGLLEGAGLGVCIELLRTTSK